MSDETLTYEREPDGWMVMHGTYGFGPFPTQAAAQVVSDHTLCTCERTVIPVYIPTGIVMSIDVTGLQEYFDRRTIKVPGADLDN